ncbi:MAG: DUF2946 family protein, partial [Planctomycetaceae bacterium]
HSHAHSCSHSHSHSDNSEHHHHQGGVPLHDDDCSVCQFHSIQVISAPQDMVADHFEVIRPVEPLDVLRPEAPVLSRPLSRGPPALTIA